MVKHKADDPSHDTDHIDLTSAGTVIGLFTECFSRAFQSMLRGSSLIGSNPVESEKSKMENLVKAMVDSK